MQQYALNSRPNPPPVIIVPPKMTPLLEIPTCSMGELEIKYNTRKALEGLNHDHEQLIKVILEEEENLISTHRSHID